MNILKCASGRYNLWRVIFKWRYRIPIRARNQIRTPYFSDAAKVICRFFYIFSWKQCLEQSWIELYGPWMLWMYFSSRLFQTSAIILAKSVTDSHCLPFLQSYLAIGPTRFQWCWSWGSLLANERYLLLCPLATLKHVMNCARTHYLFETSTSLQLLQQQRAKNDLEVHHSA